MSPHYRDKFPVGKFPTGKFVIGKFPMGKFLVAGLVIGCATFLTFSWGTARSAVAQSDSNTTEQASEASSDVAVEPTDGKEEVSTAVATARQPDLIGNLAIFVLAVFVGFEVITKVPPTLHTPLMSGSNAISGITLVGALTIAGTGVGGLEPFVGFLAVVLATINVVGGFAVTNRMLSMFRKR